MRTDYKNREQRLCSYYQQNKLQLHRALLLNIQLHKSELWSMLALSQTLDNKERDIGDNYLLSISNTSPIADSNKLQSTSTDFSDVSMPSTRFTFSPATGPHKN